MKCQECGHVTTSRAPKLAACANPAHCWRWDHACWAKRMKGRASARASSAAPVAPAMVGGREVPNLTIAA